jgi:hypothetical protein
VAWKLSYERLGEVYEWGDEALQHFTRGHSQLPASQGKSNKYDWDLADWLERLTANAEVATVLGSIPANSDTMESESADEVVLNI